MDDAAALAEIRRAAQAALDVWPEARAAVLFGSRARGCHRSDSDWDIAFITKGGGDRIGVPPEGLFRHRDVGAYVNDVTLSERLVRRKAGSVGHVAHAVTADGQVIAGAWKRPEIRGHLHMDRDKYRDFVAAALEMTEMACKAMTETARIARETYLLKKADRFATSSSGAAEFLAKAIMCRHAVSWEHSHDMNVLAGQLRKAGHETMAARVARMNGRSRADHLAMYGGTDAPSLAHAIQRLPVTLDLLRDELTDISAGFPDSPLRGELREDAAVIYADLAETLHEAMERDGIRPSLPPDCEWIQPLLDFRPVLAEKLESVSSRLREFDATAQVQKDLGGEEGWEPPEPKPFSGSEGDPSG